MYLFLRSELTPSITLPLGAALGYMTSAALAPRHITPMKCLAGIYPGGPPKLPTVELSEAVLRQWTHIWNYLGGLRTREQFEQLLMDINTATADDSGMLFSGGFFIATPLWDSWLVDSHDIEGIEEVQTAMEPLWRLAMTFRAADYPATDGEMTPPPLSPAQAAKVREQLPQILEVMARTFRPESDEAATALRLPSPPPSYSAQRLLDRVLEHARNRNRDR